MRNAPAGLVLVEDVAPEEQRIHLAAHSVGQDLLEGHKGVVLAYRVVLVHAQVVILWSVRNQLQPQLRNWDEHVLWQSSGA